MNIMLFFPYHFIDEMSLYVLQKLRFAAFQFVGLKYEDSYFGHYSWN